MRERRLAAWRLAPQWLPWLAVSAVVVLLDQWTKHLVQQTLVWWFTFDGSIRVTPFFDLVLVLNPGAAFSFLSSASGWQRGLFIALALAASAMIVYLLRKHVADRLFCFALSLILGGALGNVIDRIVLGAVVDFLHFHLAQHSFPAFNLADSAITCGAGLLIWDSLRRGQVKQTHGG